MFRPRGRHRAPGPSLRPALAVVPVVLLATGGTAYAALSGGAPAPSGGAASGASVVLAAGLAEPGVALPRGAYAKDLDALEAEAFAVDRANARSRDATLGRASRSRRAALDAQTTARDAQQRATTTRAAATRAAAARAAAAKDVAVRKAALAAAEVRASQFVRPAGGPLTSPFGRRWGRLHAGIDFGAAFGSPVRAVAAGTVTESGFDAGGYGNFVHVTHADGTMTSYNHMSRVLRASGPVQAGDVLGLIGSTGHSTGPHLHFEVRIGGTPVDPRPWLRGHGIVV